MCKNMRILNKTPKTHNARHGKGGFTLVELCVVLALLAILAVGITSFSVLMNGFAADASEETAFWEENAALKSELRRWIAQENTSLWKVACLNLPPQGRPKTPTPSILQAAP